MSVIFVSLTGNEGEPFFVRIDQIVSFRGITENNKVGYIVGQGNCRTAITLEDHFTVWCMETAPEVSERIRTAQVEQENELQRLWKISQPG